MTMRIGEALRERGLVTQRDLDEARNVQRQIGGTLGATLVRLGAISEEDLIAALSDALRIPVLDRTGLPGADLVRETIARLRVPLAWLAEREAIVWHDGNGQLVLASARAYDPELREAAEQWSTEPVRFLLASSQLIKPLLGEVDGAVRKSGLSGDPARLRELAEEAPVIDFVNAMFAEAVASRASDIHIEPFEDEMVVRMRIDGTLTRWRSGPRAAFDAIASRIKLLSDMDIAERRLPQDGRQSIRVAGQDVDLRVSSLPTVWGESIVLRFLGKTRNLPTLEGLGLAPDDADRLLALSERPSGILLVTGPTGSGKTTTVYRLLDHLNDGQRKIVTVEDPVEIDLPGVLQMNIRAEIGLDFATGLRSILRQDPDVIFVGEIRDPETARIAVQAALTGHLVISTVHTSSAIAAVTRLLDLGIEAFLLGEVLTGMIGQRLLRRVDPSAPDGYRGRIGAYEIVTVDEAMRDAIRAGASQGAMLDIARASGFRTMREDALDKVARGLTSTAEVRRVLGA